MEQGFKAIEKDIKQGTIANPVLLFGKEQYLIDWALSLFKEAFVNPMAEELDILRLEGDKINLPQLMEFCETVPMLSEKRIIIVSDFPPLFPKKTKKKKSKGEESQNNSTDNAPSADEDIDADDIDDDIDINVDIDVDVQSSKEYEQAFMAVVKDLPPTCLLVFTGQKADKRKKLFKAISAIGRAYELSTLDIGTLRGFVRKKFKEGGKSISPLLVDELINLSGYLNKEGDYTLYNLERDIQKVLAHADKEEITSFDIVSTISSGIETYVFTMIDALSTGNKAEAYQLFFNITSSGDSIFGLLALIGSQFETILEVKELAEEGKNSAQMEAILGIHSFRIKKALSLLPRYSAKDLKRILSLIYSTEGRIKSGQVEQGLAMELLLSQI